VVGRPIPFATGYAVPLVTEVLPAHQGTFEEVKDRVRTEYVDEQARERASARATELSEALGRQERKDLKRAAQSLRLEAKTSEPLTRASRIPQVGSPVELDPALFTKQPGEVAGPFPAADGHVVFQIASREAPKEEEFPGMQPAIEQRLLNDKKNQAFAVFQDSLRSNLEAQNEWVIDHEVLSRMNQGIPGEHPPYPHSHPPGF
jgi:peptidyl-prolyl cis-trans isomerase D